MDTSITQIIVTVLTCLFGTGLWTFIGDRLKRKDAKEDKHDEIIERLDNMEKSFTEQISDVKNDVKNLSEKQDRDSAILARTHILRFNDEILNQVEHSHDYYLQTLDDGETYEKYCKLHPDFSNGRTVTAMENIKRTYQRLFDNHKF